MAKNSFQGAAYVSTRTGATWTAPTALPATADGATGDRFGFSVSLSGNGHTALVGAFNNKIGSNNFQGAAYVFTYNGTWSAPTEFTAADGAANDFFGGSVALSSDGLTALVGAYGKNAAYVSTYNGTTWSAPTALPTPADAAANDTFGRSVALSYDGSTALVGAASKKIGNNAGQGAAYVFAPTSTGCNPLVVTSNADDGTGRFCGKLSNALIHATSGQTITFGLIGGNTITFSGSLLTDIKVQTGVNITGGTFGTATRITINGNGVTGDGLHLRGGNTLTNLTILSFVGKQVVLEGTGNHFQGVVVNATGDFLP